MIASSEKRFIRERVGDMSAFIFRQPCCRHPGPLKAQFGRMAPPQRVDVVQCTRSRYGRVHRLRVLTGDMQVAVSGRAQRTTE